MPSLVPLVETFRGGTRECVYFGALAVSDASGRVLAQAGDPHWLTFTRSTLKPLQALPFVAGGGVQHFGLTPANLALLCASHNGEAMHVQQVEEILGKAGVGYRRLQCGCHVPYFAELGAWPPPAPGSYDERHHNCSGKHSGFLAYCVQHGSRWTPTSTRRIRCSRRSAGPSPTQWGWRRLSSPWASTAAPRRTTRCRSRTSRAVFARLASGTRDARHGESFAQLAQAMTAHPDLVSGTGRNDLAFMQAGRGDWVTKVGAEACRWWRAAAAARHSR